MRPESAVLWCLLACQGGGGGADAEALKVVGLAIEPEEAELVTGPAGGETQQFLATVTYEDGTVEDVDFVEWSSSNRTAGSVDETGLFTPSSENGGVTWVTAALGGKEAQATVDVLYTDTIDDEGLAGQFESESGVPLDAWTYPEDGVALPRNTPSIRFQWDEGVLADAWRVRFRSEFTDITAYTSAHEFEADGDLWASIAATNAGGTVEVELARAVAGLIDVSDPLEIQVNRMDQTGSIFYWSTSDEGFMEIPYGGEVEPWLTSDDVGECIGCHAASPHDTMAFTYGESTDGWLGVKEIETRDDVLGYNEEYFGNLKAWRPDGDLLVTAFYGQLMMYDAETIEYLGEIAGPEGGGLTHPDWSPDGKQLVVTKTSNLGDWYFQAGQLAVMDYLGDGQFGDPVVLYDPDPGCVSGCLKAYYPAWSPDGEWIAFNVASGTMWEDETAEVWVIAAEGGDPIRLDAANLGEDLGNSWPRWGPLPDDDILWLTFASNRTYGNSRDDEPKIWVSAFDAEEAELGLDPSFPAFFLPSQDEESNNHLPVWVE